MAERQAQNERHQAAELPVPLTERTEYIPKSIGLLRESTDRYTMGRAIRAVEGR